jgi:hypothetical protein
VIDVLPHALVGESAPKALRDRIFAEIESPAGAARTATLARGLAAALLVAVAGDAFFAIRLGQRNHVADLASPLPIATRVAVAATPAAPPVQPSPSVHPMTLARGPKSPGSHATKATAPPTVRVPEAATSRPRDGAADRAAIARLARELVAARLQTRVDRVREDAGYRRHAGAHRSAARGSGTGLVGIQLTGRYDRCLTGTERRSACRRFTHRARLCNRRRGRRPALASHDHPTARRARRAGVFGNARCPARANVSHVGGARRPNREHRRLAPRKAHHARNADGARAGRHRRVFARTDRRARSSDDKVSHAIKNNALTPAVDRKSIVFAFALSRLASDGTCSA